MLLGVASEIGMDVSCNDMQPLSSSAPCDKLCPKRLFFGAAVQTVNETKLNLSLDLLAARNQFIVDGIELTPSNECERIIATTTPPIPTCTRVESTLPSTSSEQSPSDMTEFGTTPGSSQSDFFAIILVLVVLIAVTIVLLTVAFVVLMCFLNRKKSGSDFPSDV